MTTNPLPGEPLKPCPFCGGEAVIDDGQLGDLMKLYTVGCEEMLCPGQQSVSLGDLDAAIKRWNCRARRAPVEAAPGLVGELREALRRRLDGGACCCYILVLEGTPPDQAKCSWCIDRALLARADAASPQPIPLDREAIRVETLREALTRRLVQLGHVPIGECGCRDCLLARADATDAAALIAAAPELLGALKEVCRERNVIVHVNDALLDKWRALIARVEGKP